MEGSDEFAELLRSGTDGAAWKELDSLVNEDAAYKLRQVGFQNMAQEDAQGVPACVWDSLQKSAQLSVRMLVLHKVRARQHQRLRALPASQQSGLIERAVDAVAACPYLSQWPVPVLLKALNTGTVISLESGDTLFCKGEKAWLGLALWGSLTVHGGEGHGRDATVEGPAPVFSTKAALRKKPCPHTVTCAAGSSATVLELPCSSVLDKMQELPASLQERDIFVELAGLTAQARKLRSLHIFSEVSQACLQKIEAGLSLTVYEDGELVCEAGQPAKQLLLLLSGRLSVHKVVSKSINMGDMVDAREVHGVGVLEFYFQQLFPYTLRAAGTCIVAGMSRRDLMVCLDAASTEEVKRNCFEHRLLHGRRERNVNGGAYERHWVDAFALTPVVGHACSVEIFRALRLSIAVPQQVIVSSTSMCDRILLITNGTVEYRMNGQRVPCGDFSIVGLTCFAEHKWMHPLVAATYCDVWAIKREDVLVILKRHRVVKQVLRWCDTTILSTTAAGPDVVLFPTPDLDNFRTHLYSMRAPMFHRTWHPVRKEPPVDDALTILPSPGGALAAASAGGPARPAADRDKPDARTSRERLALVQSPCPEQLPSCASMSVVVKSCREEDQEQVLHRGKNMKREEGLALRLPRSLAKRHPEGGGEAAAVREAAAAAGDAAFGELVVTDDAAEDDPQEIFSEVELSRMHLARFLGRQLPFRPLPDDFFEASEEESEPEPEKKAPAHHARAAPVALRQLAATTPGERRRYHEERTFLACIDQKQKKAEERSNGERKPLRRPGRYGKYIDGAFRWFMVPPRQRRAAAEAAEAAAAAAAAVVEEPERSTSLMFEPRTPRSPVSPCSGRTPRGRQKSIAAWFFEQQSQGAGARRCGTDLRRKMAIQPRGQGQSRFRSASRYSNMS